MAFVLDPSESVPREVRRVATERLDEAIVILEHLDRADPDEIERAVHSVRKRCKEVRAVARLVRSSIGDEFDRCNRTVREAADALAPIRDAHAVLATFDDLRAAGGRDDDSGLAKIRSGQAVAAAAATRTIHGGDPRIAAAHDLLVTARGRVARWKLRKGFSTLSDGIETAYRRGRRDLERARKRPTDEAVHEWRKSVKTLWYHVRLIEQAAPSALSPLAASLDDLSEALGDDHDLAVLLDRLADAPDPYGGAEAVEQAGHLARQQQEDLRRRAFRLGTSVYAESPDAFVRRIEGYWQRAVRLGPELPTGGIAELTADERGHHGPTTTPIGTVAAECERKFLVRTVPNIENDGIVLRQGYLAIDGSVSARVRDAGTEGCTLTIKAGRGTVRTEIEFPLTAEQFTEAWAQTGGRRINKTRYRLPIDEHVVELDVFHDDLEGLVVAEVEFESETAATEFDPPDWFGREVTDDVEFTNAALAMNASRGVPTGATVA